MDTPQFTDGQFLDQVALNQMSGLVKTSIEQVGALTNTPGLLNVSLLSMTPSLNTVVVTAPPPFAVLFGSGVLANANGTVDGAISDTITLNFASLIPGSGSVTAYILAAATTTQAIPYEDTGPPIGHPDYNPNFVPVLAYADVKDSLLITASLTAPDNVTTFEFGRITLSAGQTSIALITTNYQVQGSSILAPSGVVAGTYAGATVTVGIDGRISGVSAVPYGPLAGSNTWTGTNAFSGVVTTPNGTTGNEVVNYTQLSSEATTRSSEDTNLQNQINSEATTRSSEDTNLQNQINSLSGDISTLTTEVNTLNTAVNAAYGESSQTFPTLNPTDSSTITLTFTAAVAGYLMATTSANFSNTVSGSAQLQCLINGASVSSDNVNSPLTLTNSGAALCGAGTVTVASTISTSATTTSHCGHTLAFIFVPLL